MSIEYPKITVDPVPHIKRIDLMKSLSPIQLESIDKVLDKWAVTRPNVDGPGEVYPWDFVRWVKTMEGK